MPRYAVFVFALFLSGAMSVLNAQVEVPKEVRGDEDYINWESTCIEGGSSGFIVHPNGNLIMNHNNEFFEVDGLTGEQIRAFPVQYGFQDYINYDVTPDGKYFAYTLYGDSTVTFIIDYESGEIYKRLRGLGQELAFLSNTQLLAERFGAGIAVYTIGNDSIITVFANSSRPFAASPDSKLIASALNAKESSTSPVYTWFELRDAQSHKKLKSVKFEEEMGVTDIKFSPDGRYVAFGTYGLYIYQLPEFELVKKYTQEDYIYGHYEFSLLDNNLIAITAGSADGRHVSVFDVMDSTNTKLFYSSGKGGGGIGYSPLLNSLFVRGLTHTSFNLTKILANVSVEETALKQILVNYVNGILEIQNLNPIDNNTLVKIIDIQGNVLFQFPIAISQENSFSIPIPLPNGAYILSIDEQAYKFLVLE